MRFPDSFAIITDEVSQDPAVVAKLLREFRLPGIELRSMFGRAFKDLTADDIAQVSQLARDEGVRVVGCATPVFKCELNDKAAVDSHCEIFKRSLETAMALECDLLRVFTFMRPAQPATGPLLRQVADQLNRLIEMASGTPVRIGIENEHSCTVATDGELAHLFAFLPDRRAGIIWDPCNILYLPAGPAPVTAGFHELASRIHHIHVKDAARVRRPDGRSTATSLPVGLGDVGWRTHLGTIQQRGYSGMLSLETHWRRKQIAEELLHLPAGYAFSEGGEDASRSCLQNLQCLTELQS